MANSIWYGVKRETAKGTSLVEGMAEVKPISKSRSKQRWVEQPWVSSSVQRGKPKVYSDGRYTYIYGLKWED